MAAYLKKGYLLVIILPYTAGEWWRTRRTCDKLVQKNAQTPYIDRWVVHLPFHHLRRQVVQCTAQRLSPYKCQSRLTKCLKFCGKISLAPTRQLPGGWGVYTPPKVCQLQDSISADDYVFRFDVPVDNFTVMKMLQSRSDLFDIL